MAQYEQKEIETKLSEHDIELATYDPTEAEKQAKDIIDAATKYASKTVASLQQNYESAYNEIKAIKKNLEKEMDVMEKKANELGVDLFKTEIGKKYLDIFGRISEMQSEANIMKTSFGTYSFK